MGTVAGLALAFVVGVAVGRLVRCPVRQEFGLLMSIQLDATQPVTITAVGTDAEGNLVNLVGTDLTITAVAVSGVFGEVNDANDTFNPGEAGATGIISGSVTVDGAVYTAEVHVELVAGALTSLSLQFAPTD